MEINQSHQRVGNLTWPSVATTVNQWSVLLWAGISSVLLSDSRGCMALRPPRSIKWWSI